MGGLRASPELPSAGGMAGKPPPIATIFANNVVNAAALLTTRVVKSGIGVTAVAMLSARRKKAASAAFGV
jgi:hypothetical protein